MQIPQELILYYCTIQFDTLGSSHLPDQQDINLPKGISYINARYSPYPTLDTPKARYSQSSMLNA